MSQGYLASTATFKEKVKRTKDLLDSKKKEQCILILDQKKTPKKAIKFQTGVRKPKMNYNPNLSSIKKSQLISPEESLEYSKTAEFREKTIFTDNQIHGRGPLRTNNKQPQKMLWSQQDDDTI